jgi:hypothetical protein
VLVPNSQMKLIKGQKQIKRTKTKEKSKSGRYQSTVRDQLLVEDYANVGRKINVAIKSLFFFFFFFFSNCDC